MPKKVPLKFPPGFFREGTKYEAKGRWYDGNLIRWYEGVMQGIGGWQEFEETSPATQQVDLDGPARGIVAWRANDRSAHMIVGTHQSLYHFAGGVLSDITPGGFSAGNVDASYSGGFGGAAYGDGAYGAGAYGAGDSAQSTLLEANTWQVDTYGEDVVAVAYSDGSIYYYDKSASSATALSGAPSGCVGVVVTPERFIVALGADSDSRTLKWHDRDSTSTWTALPANSAGAIPLPGSGKIMAGRRSRTETLIWTDIDLFSMNFIGGSLVYGLKELGSNCGAISRHSMALMDGRAVWMGKRDFYVYDGFVQKIPSEVADYVFSDLNRSQASKINTIVRSEFSEITWHYPGGSSAENDKYVTLTLSGRTPFWTFGDLPRTAGVDRGVFEYPISFDPDGLGWQHEFGTSYPVGGSNLVPFAESGPFEIAEGDDVMTVVGMIPDENTLGDVNASIIGAFYPTGTETTFGPFTPASKEDFRLTARQVRLRLDQIDGNWRWGTPRLLVERGGER